jgi:K+-transporting ATPase c subunit
MRLFIQSILLTIVFTVLTGLVYPLVMTGIAQVA